MQLAADSGSARGLPRQVRDPLAARWYVAETLPAREEIAIQNLRRQQFISFYPRFRKLRRHARRQGTVLSPLFPGYVFIRFDPDRQPWHSINGTFGIRRLVSATNARPQPIPEAVIQHILARCQDDIARLLDSPEPGQSVRIIAGPFADKLALIEKLDGKGRVRLLLDLLGGPCSVDMSLECLAPAA